jgi:phospholipase C
MIHGSRTEKKIKKSRHIFYLTIENKTYDQQFGTFPEKLSNFRPFYDIVYQLVQFQRCQQKNSNQIYNQLKSYFSKGVSV